MKKITTICFAVLIKFSSLGQISNYIYALNNDSNGVFYFCRVEISTGAITNFQLATTNHGSNFSSCINNQTQKYYLCSGTTLKTFDPLSGNLLSTVSLPISVTATFLHIQYNPCNSNIYGIINDYPANISFARFDPLNGVMTIISAMNLNTTFCGGCMSILDPDEGIYAFDNGSIIGLNINTGQIVYSSPIINLPDESFSHIALKCNSHEIFGTSANVNLGVKYLSTINPYSGVVTHVSSPGWNVGVLKPLGGGNCIDLSTGDYYYSGSPNILVGANTSTGNMTYNQSVNSGELYSIQHFSECICKPTLINELSNAEIEISFMPNPFSKTLNLTTNVSGENEILLYDITSRKLVQQRFSNSVSLGTEQLANGIYLYEIRFENGLSRKGRVLKD